MEIAAEVRLAAERIEPFIRRTMLAHSAYLSQISGAHVYLKMENLQHTGSFKARGALSKLLSLSEAQRQLGVVTASSGNHGAAVAYGLRQLGSSGIIFVPKNASSAKVEAIRRLGGDVRFFGDDSGKTEMHARQHAEENGMVYLSPYNDLQVVAGQGTIGLEISQQLDQFDALFASIGGGGLISGIGGYLKSVSPAVEIIGSSPANSCVMIESVKAGRVLDLPSTDTLSDGTAGGVEPGAITFDMCRQYVDSYDTVSEQEIREAMRMAMVNLHILVEGAAGVAIASFLKQKERFAGKRVAIVVCGANISLDTLRGVLA